jgi:hypothetical protein
MKSKNFLKLWAIFIILGLALATSCTKDKDPDPATGTATFSITLGDSPADYEAVNVEILRVNANINGSWQEYAVAAPGVYNLLELINGNTLLLLAPTPVASGSISELRLILGENNTIVVDGVTFELKTPSGQTSGYKIKMGSQPLLAGETYHLVLDFDVNQSVHPAGPNNYILKPVVRGYLETSIGQMSGTITPVNSAWYVMATNAVDTAGTYINQSNGTFRVNTLNPGIYNVHIYANPGFRETDIYPVVITAGQLLVLDNIMIEPM